VVFEDWVELLGAAEHGVFLLEAEMGFEGDAGARVEAKRPREFGLLGFADLFLNGIFGHVQPPFFFTLAGASRRFGRGEGRGVDFGGDMFLEVL